MVNRTVVGLGILFIIVTILNVVFDPNLGSVFGLMLAFSWIYFNFDKSRRYELEKNKNRLKSLAFAGGGFVMLTLISSVLFPLFGQAIGFFDFASTIQVISETRNSILLSQVNPALAGNLGLNIGVFGFLIPFIETIWLIVLLEFFHDSRNIRPNLRSTRTWTIIAIITSIFTVLHFSALGVTNNVALANVIIFTVITMVIAIKEGQMLGAILFHVVANTSALLLSGQFAGLLDNPGLVTLAVVIGAFFVLTSKIVKSIFSRSTTT